MEHPDKILVIAEKPSVGRDLARVLPGPFAKHEGFLEGPEHVITWAVGHLVQLAEPDEYDPKFKRSSRITSLKRSGTIGRSAMRHFFHSGLYSSGSASCTRCPTAHVTT